MILLSVVLVQRERVGVLMVHVQQAALRHISVVMEEQFLIQMNAALHVVQETSVVQILLPACQMKTWLIVLQVIQTRLDSVMLRLLHFLLLKCQ
jgi:hypothetical protein